MGLVVNGNGQMLLLQQLKAQWGTSLVGRLYSNNYTPTINDAAANFTQATFPGYVAPNITWGTPTWYGDHAELPAVASFTWTASGPGGLPVYGYYVTDSAGTVVWAERDPGGPIDMSGAGFSYTILFKFTIQSLYPSG